MPEFIRKPNKFLLRGVNLASPDDAMAEGDYNVGTNVFQEVQGEITSRPGQQVLYATQTPDPNVHSVRRLNGLGQSLRIMGAGTNLYKQDPIGLDPIQIDAGYDGDPLSLIPVRPDQDTKPWMYVTSSTQMSKVSTAGVVRQIGVVPPNKPPVAQVASSAKTTIASFGGTVGWFSIGSAGAPAAGNRLSTLVSQVFYEPYTDALGILSYAVFVPVIYQFTPGMVVDISNGGGTDDFNCVVEEVFDPLPATTVLAILYDTGSVGDCTIVLRTPTGVLKKNSVLQIGGEILLVDEVIEDRSNSGEASIRVTTVFTHGTGESVTGLPAFRTRVPIGYGIYAGGSTINSKLLSFPVGVGTGSLQIGVAEDLTISGFQRPLNSDDYIHISLRFAFVSALTSCRIAFDVDRTLNNFTRNYYEYVLPAALLAKIGEQTWVEVKFRVSDLQRVGTDTSRTLQNVGALMIEATATNTVVIDASSWFISGSYGPDTDAYPIETDGIRYRFRYRDSETGAKSVPGPATRYLVQPQRQAVTVVCSGTSPTRTGIDKIDIERLDPKLQAGLVVWAYVGTVSNPGAGLTVTFIDDQAAALIASNPPLETNVFQPVVVSYPTITASGTVCGCVVLIPGTTVPIGIIAGSIVQVFDKSYQTYGNPIPTVAGALIFLTESVSNGTGITSVKIIAPSVAGSVLPYMFGPLEGPTATFVFWLGDPLNPGTLYFCNGNDPDSMSDSNFVEVTSPNEPLISGAVHNTFTFVGSNKRPFQIQPTFSLANLFTPYELVGYEGFWSRWAVSTGPSGIQYLGHNGIYEVAAQSPSHLISQDLWPLFPHEGKPGQAKNGYNPVDMTDRANLRLSNCEGVIYFDYTDVNGNRLTWTRTRALLTDGNFGYLQHKYANPANVHYQDEVPQEVATSQLVTATINGFLMFLSPTFDTDNGFPIPCVARTRFDMLTGENRTQKLIGDSAFEIQSNGNITGTTVLGLTDNNSTLTPIVATVGASSLTRTQYIVDANAGQGFLARNLAFEFQWTAKTGHILYEWHQSYVPKPPRTNKLNTDYTDDGYVGAKYFRGLVIEANTLSASGAAQTRTVQVWADGVVKTALQVYHNGQVELPYALPNGPFIASEVKLTPIDAFDWELFTIRWIWDKYPENSYMYTEDFNELGGLNGKYVRALRLEADTQNVAIPVAVEIDGILISNPASFSATHNGKSVKEYSFATPFNCNNIRLRYFGDLRVFGLEWVFDAYPTICRTITPWANGGTNDYKLIKGVRPRVDTNNVLIQVQVQVDGGTTVTTIPMQGNGQQILTPIPFSPPIKAYLMRLAPQGDWRFFEADWIYDQYPDFSAMWGTWTDDGYPGNKWLQGMIVTADSNNTPVSFAVQTDQGQVLITTPAKSYNNMTGIAYSWSPVLTHQMRLIPFGAVSTQSVQWIWKPSPESATLWQTPQTSHGFDSFSHHRDMVVRYRSSSDLILQIKGDGNAETYVIPNSGGLVDKRFYFQLNPTKARLWDYTVASASPFELYKEDTVIRLKPWAGAEFQDFRPFGGDSFTGVAPDSGAKV